MRAVSQALGTAMKVLGNQDPNSRVGAALGEFQQVLQNTLSEDEPQLVERSEQTDPLAQAAAQAESGRFTSFGSGATQALGEAGGAAISGRIERTKAAEQEARTAAQTMMAGGDIELHEVMLASQRAQLELQFTMRLRNKLVEAYQEIMRMPV